MTLPHAVHDDMYHLQLTSAHLFCDVHTLEGMINVIIQAMVIMIINNAYVCGVLNFNFRFGRLLCPRAITFVFLPQPGLFYMLFSYFIIYPYFSRLTYPLLILNFILFIKTNDYSNSNIRCNLVSV